MTEKEIDEQRRKIAEDIAERAVKGEFGWAYGRNGWSSEEELKKAMETHVTLIPYMEKI